MVKDFSRAENVSVVSKFCLRLQFDTFVLNSIFWGDDRGFLFLWQELRFQIDVLISMADAILYQVNFPSH